MKRGRKERGEEGQGVSKGGREGGETDVENI